MTIKGSLQMSIAIVKAFLSRFLVQNLAGWRDLSLGVVGNLIELPDPSLPIHYQRYHITYHMAAVTATVTTGTIMFGHRWKMPETAVFICRLNAICDSVVLTDAGRAFQARTAATRNARSPSLVPRVVLTWRVSLETTTMQNLPRRQIVSQ